MSSSGRAMRLLRGSGRSLALARGAASYPREPLTNPIDVETQRRDATLLAQSLSRGEKETRVTSLENGLRVASQEAFGQYSTVGGERFAGECERCALIGVVNPQCLWTRGVGTGWSTRAASPTFC